MEKEDPKAGKKESLDNRYVLVLPYDLVAIFVGLMYFVGYVRNG